MMRKNLQSRPMSDAHIHAYVDGQLKQERGQTLQSLLGDRPEKYEQLEEYQRINESLKNSLQHILTEPIPNSILTLLNQSESRPAAANNVSRIQPASAKGANLRSVKPEPAPAPAPSKPARESRSTKADSKPDSGISELNLEDDLDYKYKQLRKFGNSLRTIPIIIIFCLISFIVGWNVRNQFQFSEERVADFVNNAINSHGIYAGQEQELTELRSINRVLRKRFSRPLQIPDTREMTLRGGRILPYGQSGVAALMEYRINGKTISLYVTQQSGLVTVEIPFCENVKPSTVCYWHRDDMNFAVIGKMKDDKLRLIAKSFLQKLLHKPSDS